MISGPAALAALAATGDAHKAAEMAVYHKAPRAYIGLSVPDIEAHVRDWRRGAETVDLVVLARFLWASDVHEARLAAAKLLTRPRFPDHEDLVWQAFRAWVPDFDAWALADHACKAGELRIIAHPARLDTVETWTRDANKWVRRAALVATLPWSRLKKPGPEDIARRERILRWAAAYVPDRDWFIQKAIAWWLRTLSRQDPERVGDFLSGPGTALKPFARREAAKYL